MNWETNVEIRKMTLATSTPLRKNATTFKAISSRSDALNPCAREPHIAIELNNFTKSLTRPLIKLNELDRAKWRWCFSAGRRRDYAIPITSLCQGYYLEARAAPPAWECWWCIRTFFFHEFSRLPAGIVILLSWCYSTRNHIHCLITSCADCFSLYSGCATWHVQWELN